MKKVVVQAPKRTTMSNNELMEFGDKFKCLKYDFETFIL
jgi:hypothetical protein